MLKTVLFALMILASELKKRAVRSGKALVAVLPRRAQRTSVVDDWSYSQLSHREAKNVTCCDCLEVQLWANEIGMKARAPEPVQWRIVTPSGNRFDLCERHLWAGVRPR